mgnify:CR=1 FL=1
MFILSLCYFAIYNLPLKYNDRSSGLFVIEYTLPLYKTINYQNELLVCYCTAQVLIPPSMIYCSLLIFRCISEFKERLMPIYKLVFRDQKAP